MATILDLIWMHHRGDDAPPRPLRHGGRHPRLRAPCRPVIALSEAGRDDLVQTLGVPRERIDVTPLGVRIGGSAPPMPEPELRRSLELGRGRIVLCVAQKRVHKNLDALVRALASLQARDAVLVLPGAPTPYEDELRRLATALGVADRVRFPAGSSAEQLQGLYAAASCFVLASDGGLRPAGRRGDAARRAGRVLERVGAAGGGGRRRAAVRPAGRRRDRRGRRPPARRSGAGRASSALAVAQRCAELTWERTAQATFASYRRAIAQRAARR